MRTHFFFSRFGLAASLFLSKYDWRTWWTQVNFIIFVECTRTLQTYCTHWITISMYLYLYKWSCVKASSSKSHKRFLVWPFWSEKQKECFSNSIEIWLDKEYTHKLTHAGQSETSWWKNKQQPVDPNVSLERVSILVVVHAQTIRHVTKVDEIYSVAKRFHQTFTNFLENRAKTMEISVFECRIKFCIQVEQCEWNVFMWK